MRVADPVSHYMRDAEFFDYFAESSVEDKDSAVRLQQAVFGFARMPEKGLVLDIGSGNGWLAAKLKGSDLRVVSVDISLRNVTRIRALGGMHQVVADAARLPFRPGVFDLAVASEILEHLNEPSNAVAGLAGTLRQGGMLIASTPYRELIRTYLCIHCNKPTPANAHLHSFDEKSLGRMFSDTGLTDIRHELRHNKAFIQLRLSRVLRFVPFKVWRVLDGLCNRLLRKPTYIIIKGKNSGTI
jgi:SAM-dependent methyltransferase